MYYFILKIRCYFLRIGSNIEDPTRTGTDIGRIGGPVRFGSYFPPSSVSEPVSILIPTFSYDFMVLLHLRLRCYLGWNLTE